jgi:ArsR family metal-binding transcriptional regulator
VGQASLSLPAGENRVSQRELSVVNNILAYEVSNGLLEAGMAATKAEAKKALERARSIIAVAMAHYPELSREPSVARDMKVLSSARALNNSACDDCGERESTRAILSAIGKRRSQPAAPESKPARIAEKS